jgi:hypothetical protein
MPSDAARRTAVAKTMQPTQRERGYKLDLRISLYNDGHASLGSVPSSEQLNCRDDLGLIAELAFIVRRARELVAQRDERAA